MRSFSIPRAKANTRSPIWKRAIALEFFFPRDRDESAAYGFGEFRTEEGTGGESTGTSLTLQQSKGYIGHDISGEISVVSRPEPALGDLSGRPLHPGVTFSEIFATRRVLECNGRDRVVSHETRTGLSRTEPQHDTLGGQAPNPAPVTSVCFLRDSITV